MGRNTAITLDDHFEAFAADLVREGRYASVGEAVKAGLRLLEDEEARLKALRRAVEEGEASGYPEEPFDFEAFRRRMHERHASKV